MLEQHQKTRELISARRARLRSDKEAVDGNIAFALDQLAPPPKVSAREWPLYLQRIGYGKVTLSESERASLRADAIYAHRHAYLCRGVRRFRNKRRFYWQGQPSLAFEDTMQYAIYCADKMPRWRSDLPKKVEAALQALEAKFAAQK